MKILKPRFNHVNARQSFIIRVVDNCNSLPASLIDTVHLIRFSANVGNFIKDYYRPI